MKFNITEIEDCILDRRTITPEFYSSRKVHKEIITRLLNAARWAPNHGKTQPWHFKVFTGEALPKLGDKMAEIYKSTTPEAQFKQEKHDKIKGRPSLGSVVIAICMKRGEKPGIPIIEEIEAVACAVQNMHLMATAYGLGGFWATPSPTYTREMCDYLNLEGQDQCLGFFYLGYPAEEWPKSSRKPLEYHTEWIEE